MGLVNEEFFHFVHWIISTLFHGTIGDLRIIYEFVLQRCSSLRNVLHHWVVIAAYISRLVIVHTYLRPRPRRWIRYNSHLWLIIRHQMVRLFLTTSLLLLLWITPTLILLQWLSHFLHESAKQLVSVFWVEVLVLLGELLLLLRLGFYVWWITCLISRFHLHHLCCLRLLSSRIVVQPILHHQHAPSFSLWFRLFCTIANIYNEIRFFINLLWDLVLLWEFMSEESDWQSACSSPSKI